MKKRIAFDLHGVLDTYPDILKPMIKILESVGHEIYVISGPKQSEIIDSLNDCFYQDVGFMRMTSHIKSVVDFLIARNEKFTYDENGNPWTDEQTWWNSKARICKEFAVDILVDDSLKYKPAFELINSKYIHINELING